MPALRLHVDLGQPGPSQVLWQRGHSDSCSGHRVDEQRRTVVGRQTELRPPRAEPIQVGRRRDVAQGELRQLVGGASRGQQGPADPIGPGQHGLANEVGPEFVQFSGGQLTEGLDEPGPGRDPGIDGARGEVVLEDDLCMPYAR